MEANDTPIPGAAPASSASIGGGAPSPVRAKPRWDPKGKRNMIVIGGVVGTALLLLLLLSFGGGDREEKKASAIVESKSDQPVVTGMLSEADRAAMAKQENERIAAALTGGQSAVGNQVGAGAAQPNMQGTQQQPITQQGEMRVDQYAQQPAPAAQAPAQTAPAGTDQDRLKGLEKQMDSMMTAWGMGQGDGQRTLSTYIRDSRKSGNASDSQGGQGNAGQASTQRPANDLMVVEAYDMPHAAEMISGADSDTPGKLRARINSGPLAGAVVKGSAQRIGDKGFQADFTEATFKGRTFKISAYGMDGEVGGDIVRGEYDGRYAQRYVFPVLAEGVKAYAGARAQVATQVIAVPIPGAGNGGGIVTGGQQIPAPSAEQARNAMYSSGANQVSRALATGPQEGHVTLAPGTQFGLVFEESIYQSDLAGRARQGNK
ncbi:hypothetical protein ACFPOU_07980 [Massilia jejuensis]|uniref:Intracellular multiplication protein IcmE n=1 Tax=Massilia jejuensis TaxID=648894 RepID=A0ABW0PFI5_9BURK